MTRQWGRYVSAAGHFSADVGRLSAGAVASQLILLAGSPVLTRLYSAPQFAVFALFLAASGMIGQVACLKYDLAVVVAQSDELAGRMVSVCLASCVAIAGLTAAALPFAKTIAAALHTDNATWLFFLPAAALLMGTHAALSAAALRYGLLWALTASTVLRAAAQLLLQVLLALVCAGGTALCLAYLASYAAAAGLLYFTLRRQEFCARLGFARLRDAAKEQSGYAMCAMPGALANTMVYSLSSFVLSSQATAAVLGCYTMVNRVLAAPLTVVTGPVGQLFLRLLARRPTRERARMFLWVSAGMLALGAAVGGALWMASGLFPLLLGGGWELTAPILRVMLPLFVVRFAVSPVSASAIVQGRQRATMLWQMGMLLLSAAAAAATVRLALSSERYLAVFGALLITGYLIFWVYCLRVLRGGNRNR